MSFLQEDDALQGLTHDHQQTTYRNSGMSAQTTDHLPNSPCKSPVPSPTPNLSMCPPSTRKLRCSRYSAFQPTAHFASKCSAGGDTSRTTPNRRVSSLGSSTGMCFPNKIHPPQTVVSRQAIKPLLMNDEKLSSVDDGFRRSLMPPTPCQPHIVSSTSRSNLSSNMPNIKTYQFNAIPATNTCLGVMAGCIELPDAAPAVKTTSFLLPSETELESLLAAFDTCAASGYNVDGHSVRGDRNKWLDEDSSFLEIPSLEHIEQRHQCRRLKYERNKACSPDSKRRHSRTSSDSCPELDYINFREHVAPLAPKPRPVELVGSRLRPLYQPVQPTTSGKKRKCWVTGKQRDDSSNHSCSSMFSSTGPAPGADKATEKKLRTKRVFTPPAQVESSIVHCSPPPMRPKSVRSYPIDTIAASRRCVLDRKHEGRECVHFSFTRTAPVDASSGRPAVLTMSDLS